MAEGIERRSGGVFPKMVPLVPVLLTPGSTPGGTIGNPGTPGAPGTSWLPGAPGMPVVLVAESGAPGVPFRSDPCRSETRSVTRSMLSVRVPSFQLTVR